MPNRSLRRVVSLLLRSRTYFNLKISRERNLVICRVAGRQAKNWLARAWRSDILDPHDVTKERFDRCCCEDELPRPS